MKILDCTLRDGGHAVKFDWPLLMVRQYYKLMSEVGVDIIELGYWGQTDKTTNMFYNLDMSKAELVIPEGCDGSENTCSIMVDYHHCSHTFCDYPQKGNGLIDLIRVCVRKQDIQEAIPWINRLKEYTGLEVSCNVFNISNYTLEEIDGLPEALTGLQSNYLYFADTHGALSLWDMHNEWNLGLLRSLAMIDHYTIGLHFHDHLGEAKKNFSMADMYFASIADSTLFGLGKGAGNLKTEHVIDKAHLPKVMEFIERWQDKLTRPFNPYYAISASNSVCEAYAVEAQQRRMGLTEFDAWCKERTQRERDVFDKALL